MPVLFFSLAEVVVVEELIIDHYEVLLEKIFLDQDH